MDAIATACCFHADACNKRRTKGLRAWCDKSTLVSIPTRVRPANVFGDYETAAAYGREHGGRVQCTTSPGGPREFTVY
jgi:hypothetical protein